MRKAPILTSLCSEPEPAVLARRQIERQRRLAPVADLVVKRIAELTRSGRGASWEEVSLAPPGAVAELGALRQCFLTISKYEAKAAASIRAC